MTGGRCDIVACEELPSCGVRVDVPGIELFKNADRVGVEFGAFEPGIGDRCSNGPTRGLRGGCHPNVLPGRFRSCLPWTMVVRGWVGGGAHSQSISSRREGALGLNAQNPGSPRPRMAPGFTSAGSCL